MTSQFLRNISLTVTDANGNGYDFRNFRCTFAVRRGDIQTPNSLDARIYNLKDQTVKTISQAEYTQLSLSVGYIGNPPPPTPPPPQLIFQGTIKQFRQGRVNQTDSYVDLTAADGDEAYNFAPIFISIPGGNTQEHVASNIAAALAKVGNNQSISLGYVPEFPAGGLIRGKVLYGMARDAARQFAWTNNCKWSIQTGQVCFIPYTSYIPGGSIPLISVSTGLIGVPEQTQQGINIRTLLNPNIKIGQLIQLDSDINQFRFNLDFPSEKNNPLLATSTTTNEQGLYYVMQANHVGDTRGNDWYTDLVCLSVDATVPSADAVNALFTVGPVPINRYGQYGQY